MAFSSGSQLTLKARLFPVDCVDVNALLDELSELDFITKFDAKGRRYGAIRNFQRFQRPKKPNSSEALPPHLFGYVGKSGTGSEPVPHQFSTSGEKFSQMEDGGGKRKRERNKNKSSVAKATGADAPPDDPSIAERDLFRRGKEVLGKDSGGLIVELKRAKGGNVSLARAALEQASVKNDPKEFIGAIVSGKPRPPPWEPQRVSDDELTRRALERQARRKAANGGPTYGNH